MYPLFPPASRHHYRRLRQSPLRRLDLHPGSVCRPPLLPPIHVRLVGGPVPSAQYHPHPHNCLPPAVERVGGEVRQAVEGRPWVFEQLSGKTAFFSLAEAVFGTRLVLPGQFFNTAESPVRQHTRVVSSSTHTSRQFVNTHESPVRQHRRVAVAVFPRISADYHGGWPPQSTYLYIEHHSECTLVGIGTSRTLSRNASVHPLPPGPKGGHTRLRLRGWGSPNSDDWRKSLALCLLCAGRSPPPTRHNSTPAPTSLMEELLLARFILVSGPSPAFAKLIMMRHSKIFKFLTRRF